MIPEHISVCICTFIRPTLLEKLLAELETQETEGLFTYSVVITDNDENGSVRDVVAAFTKRGKLSVTYDVESRQNISLARNRADRNSVGDYIAFCDDDQFPVREWLLTLYKVLGTFKVDGILGPVKPYFEEIPPRWLVKGGFYDRPSYPTGLVIGWQNGRTGNVLLKRELLTADPQPFDPKFGSGGEDQDFFRRMISKGRSFVWCNEAITYEHDPPHSVASRFPA